MDVDSAKKKEESGRDQEGGEIRGDDQDENKKEE